MTPEKLPEEINEQIRQQAEEFANTHINGRAQPVIWEIVFRATEAGATAWAPWFVKHNAIQSELHGVRAENERLKKSNQELKDNGQRMADALEIIIAQMKTYQDAFAVPFSEAIGLGEKVLQQFNDGKGKEAGNGKA